MAELKPCPFCGGSAYDHVKYSVHTHKTRHVVKCTKCNAIMEYRNERAVIEAWNRRAGDGK